MKNFYLTGSRCLDFIKNKKDYDICYINNRPSQEEVIDYLKSLFKDFDQTAHIDFFTLKNNIFNICFDDERINKYTSGNIKFDDTFYYKLEKLKINLERRLKYKESIDLKPFYKIELLLNLYENNELVLNDKFIQLINDLKENRIVDKNSYIKNLINKINKILNTH